MPRTFAANANVTSQTNAVAPLHIGLDALATRVAVLDARGCISYANTALEQTLGQPAKHLMGKPLAHWLEDLDAFEQALQGVLREDFASLRYDAALRTPQGLLPAQVVCSKTPQSAAPVLVEITPLDAQARQEREQRLLDQTQSNKVLIRNLAHEIKNPLGGIRGAAQLLELDLAPEQREYTRVIIGETDRLQVLIDKLLAPHRQRSSPETLNIHEVCEHVRSLALLEFGNAVSIRRDYDTSIPELQADRTQLVQTLLNLVQNAAQILIESHTAAPRVTLKTRVNRQVMIGKTRHKLALDLQVIDNGPGIAPEVLDKLFYPLVTHRAGGTGLGLTLAQTFVAQHGGVVLGENSPLGGAVFKVVLPLA